MDPQPAELLMEAAATFGAVRGFIRQIMGNNIDPTEIISTDMQTSLALAAGQKNLASLEGRLISLQHDVLALYQQLIETPANAIDLPENDDS